MGVGGSFDFKIGKFESPLSIDIFAGAIVNIVTDGRVSGDTEYKINADFDFARLQGEASLSLKGDIFDSKNDWTPSADIALKKLEVKEDGANELSFKMHLGLLGTDVNVDLDILKERIYNALQNPFNGYLY